MTHTITTLAGDTNLGLETNSPQNGNHVESGQGRHLSDDIALQRLNTQFDVRSTRFADKTFPSPPAQRFGHQGRERNGGDQDGDIACILDRWDLDYLPDPGLLICRTCGLALWGYKTLTHLKDAHRHHVLPTDFDEVVQRLPLYRQNARDVPPRPADLPVVPHLKILDGYRCTLCAYASVSQRLVTEHVQEYHPDRPLRPHRLPYMAKAKVQNYYPWQNMRSYFTVTL